MDQSQGTRLSLLLRLQGSADGQAWSDFVDLFENAQARLTAHLESCSDCQRQLELLAGGSLSLPKDAAANEAQSDALAQVMLKIKGSAPPDTRTLGETRPAPLSYGFLGPSDNPRHLGSLGGYDILELIGRGGMGVVFKGRDKRLERLVAVKVLSPELASSAPARRRFLREAKSAAAVTHEHVVTIHAVDEAGDVPFLVMEYIVGVSLEDRIQRTGHLRLEEILRIGAQIASGLSAAHAQGLVHRDIKPSNILLENGVERVKITDFGLARVMHEAQSTQSNVVVGTPQYMSPEQARGESIDHRSDLFSLGCVLYAMCVGRSPFRAETPTGAIHRVCEGTPRPIHEVNADVPDSLVAIIDRLLEKRREDRFQSAREVAELLGRYLAHVQQPSMVELPRFSSAPASLRARRRFRGWKAAAVLACLCLVALAAVPFARRAKPPETGTLILDLGGPLASKMQVTISGNGQRITRDAPANEELRFRPGDYRLEFVLPERGRVVRSGTIRITQGTTQRAKFHFMDIVSIPPERHCTAELLGHGGPVRQIAFWHKDRKLAAACDDGGVYVWKLDGGEWKQSAVLRGHEGGVQSVSVSADDRLLVTGGHDKTIGLWNTADGTKIGTLTGHVSAVRSLTMSSDGARLISIDEAGNVIAWDLTTRSEDRRCRAQRGKVEWGEVGPRIVLSPDENSVATAGQGETVTLWDSRTLKRLREFQGVSRWVADLTFSPDGQFLAAADSTGTKVWSIATGELAVVLPGDAFHGNSVAFSPDGKLVASGQYKSVRLFDFVSRTMVDAFATHWDNADSIAFCPSESILATAGRDCAVRLWDISRMSPLPQSKPRPRLLNSYRTVGGPFAISADLIAMGTHNPSVIQVRRLDTWELVGEIDMLEKEDHFQDRRLREVHFLLNGETFYTAHDNGRLCLWDVDRVGRRITQRASQLVDFPQNASTRLAVSSDGQWIAAAEQRAVVLLEGESLNRLTRFENFEGLITALALCTARPILATGTENGQLAIWDVETKQKLCSALHGESRILGLAILPNGSTLASVGEEGIVRLWKFENGSLTQTHALESLSSATFSADFSPDGRWLVTSGGYFDFADENAFWEMPKPGEVKLWEVSTGRLVVDIDSPQNCAFDAKFLPDGERLAISGGFMLNVWNIAEVLKAAAGHDQ